jgi:hypothetical protein
LVLPPQSGGLGSAQGGLGLMAFVRIPVQAAQHVGATLLVVCGVVGLTMYFRSENFWSRFRKRR